MKLMPYPKYRRSGIDWLGEIPKHWEVKRLGFLCLLESGENITSELIAEGGDFPVYGGNGFRGYYHRFTHEGHFVLIGRQGALCGNINYAQGRFWASEHALIVIPTAHWDVVWMGELLRSMNLGRHSITAAQPGLAAEMLRRLRVPFPPLPEQTAIAAFLDRETGRIDRLVVKKRELIERLKEKRTALISRTVTRGLPPAAARAAGLPANPRLKHSGIDWLGEIPEHWEVLSVFRISKEIQTGPFGSQLHVSDYVESGIPLINPAHIVEGKLVPDERATVNEATSVRLSRYRLYVSDIVMARRGEIGRCAVVSRNAEGWLCGTGSVLIRLRDCSSEYFGRVFAERGFSTLLELHAVGTIMLSISPNILGRMLVPVPPLPEQTAIAAYLDEETAKLDSLVAKVEEAIERLQEYRTALITAAVTGKIDVRKEV